MFLLLLGGCTFQSVYRPPPPFVGDVVGPGSATVQAGPTFVDAAVGVGDGFALRGSAAYGFAITDNRPEAWEGGLGASHQWVWPRSWGSIAAVVAFDVSGGHIRNRMRWTDTDIDLFGTNDTSQTFQALFSAWTVTEAPQLAIFVRRGPIATGAGVRLFGVSTFDDQSDMNVDADQFLVGGGPFGTFRVGGPRVFFSATGAISLGFSTGSSLVASQAVIGVPSPITANLGVTALLGPLPEE